ncbi:hypothetical protein CBS14141_003660 [Malassezia furfur]|nr:hypothetical protein CBS14141_003660 [Malassezia furfur]
MPPCVLETQCSSQPSAQHQDTGFSTELKTAIQAWMARQTFRSVVPLDQYQSRIRILQLLAESQSLSSILEANPACSAPFVHRTRRNYTLDEHDELFYHARERKGALIVVPQPRIVDTIIQEHNAIHHQGTNKTWHEISTRYQGIPKRVVDYVIRQCQLCQRQRQGPRPAPVQAIVTQRVMERVQVDMIDMRREPDGEYQWILHIKDHFSRFCMLYPLKQGTQGEVVRYLMEWMAMLGPPAVLQMDNGEAFVNDAIARIAREHHIVIRRGSPGRPRSQGLVERANGHVRRLIAKWCRRFHERHWTQSLSSIAMACNMSKHTTVGKTPYEVVFSRRPILRRALPVTEGLVLEDDEPGDATDAPEPVPSAASEADDETRAHIAKEQARMVHAWERRHAYAPYPPGTPVSVAVQGIDRAPLDDYRIPGMVVGHRSDRGYRVCTAYGVLKRRVPARHVAPLPDQHAPPTAAVAYAADWRAAPRVSLARCVRKIRREAG